MRQVLVDSARKFRAGKRGGGNKVSLDGMGIDIRDPSINSPFLALEEALQNLEKLDARKGTILEMKYFGGLTLDEIVVATGVSKATVSRDLRSGLVLARSGKTNKALEAYRKNLGMQERIAALKKDDVSVQRTVMIAMGHVGDTLGNANMINLGRYADAAAIYGKVVERARWLVPVDPGDKKAQLDLSFALLRYSNTLRPASDLPANLRAMNEARQLFER